MASKTFRSAANTYFNWPKRRDITKTDDFWNKARFYPAKWKRFEQVLNDHVLPVIGERPMSEIWTIQNDDNQELPALTATDETDRDDTAQALFAVIRHHLYWEAESLEI